MVNRNIILLFATLIPLGLCAVANGQNGNPLRFGSETSLVDNRSQPLASAQSIPDPTIPPDVYQAIYNTNFESKPTPSKLPSEETSLTAEQPFVDRNVVPATHLAAPKSDLAPIANLLKSWPARQPEVDPATKPTGLLLLSAPEKPPSDIAAEPQSKGQFDQARFQKLLKTLAFNTCLVMGIGIGFILVAKQWFKAKKPSTRSANPTIEIKSTLKLGQKSNLFLVETGEHRLIVASDQNGIKSMVRLTDSFSNTLDSLSEMEPEIDTEVKTSTNTRVQSDAGMYSLASVGKQTGVAQPCKNDARTIDDVRHKMEKAMLDEGLKDLLLKSLEARS